MELAYHRRPLMTADDTAAMELVKLGSGVTLYGYYMFHGGTNPEGKKTDLQESQATGYPNDLPLRSYDFQAPLGEFGQVHPSFGVLKLFHLFLNDFGTELAPMTPYFPERVPTSLHDTSTPRVSARMQRDQGFIFINNYQRNYPLFEHKNFQVQLKLPSGEIEVPRRPLTIPSGAYTFWPVNLRLGQSVLRYATAQLVCKLASANTYVFAATPDIPAEFAFEEEDGEQIEAPNGNVERRAATVYVADLNPGTKPAIRLHGRGRETIDIVVLSREQAQNLWKLTLGGKEWLVLSSAQLYADGERLVLMSSDASQLKAGFFPAPEHAITGFSDAGKDGVFHMYEAHVETSNLRAKVEKLSDPGPDPALKMGKEIALMPDDSAFRSTATWLIQAPEVQSDKISDLLLNIAYEGDIARIYVGGKLLTDNFYYGEPWVIDLNRIPAELIKKPLELRILPLQARAPIYLPSGARPTIQTGGQLANVKDVEIVPVYREVIYTGK
jgi:beta-galactosidase